MRTRNPRTDVEYVQHANSVSHIKISELGDVY